MNCLTFGKEDMRKRLIDAFQGYLHVLRKSDFPSHLQNDWQWVMDQLARFGPYEVDNGWLITGSVENTMNRIKKKTGVKIAKKIAEIKSEIEKLV